MKLIVPTSKATDPAQVGGKAAALAKLVKNGFRVPEFFVIMPAAFHDGKLLIGAQEALVRAVNKLGDGPFAIRSSARDEDGMKHSHAGQFLSLLNISSDDVATAATRVSQSGQQNSVKAYRENRGLKGDGECLAVIVQRLINARCAGVMFTADPVSGRRDHIVISATEGLGDRLVSGEVDGESYVIDRNTGKTLTQPTSPKTLGKQDLQELVSLAKRIEKTTGRPQDIEWAFEDQKLYLLQSRPITTQLRSAPVSDNTVTIFDNSNIVESYPGLVSPLTFSFAQHVYAKVYRTFLFLVGVNSNTIRAHGAHFDNMLARIDGRVYYNLINWYRLLALLPGYRVNREHMETMMGVGEPLPRDIANALAPPPATGFARVSEYGRMGWMAARLGYSALRLPSTIKKFNTRLQNALKTERSTLKKRPLTSLAGEYRRIETELLEHWDAPLINDFLCMMAFGASRKLMERWAGKKGIAIHNDIMIGQGDIISAEPPRRIKKMAELISNNSELIEALARGDIVATDNHLELKAKINNYIEKFGDRCTEELKLESVTLFEDPRPLLSSIAAAAKISKTSNHETTKTPHDSLDSIFPKNPIKRTLARSALNWAKARVRDRENLRFERTRIFGHARQVFLAIGEQFHAKGLLNHPRDIFYLTVQEVLGAIEGNGISTSLNDLSAIRKKEQEMNAEKPDPPERITLKGAAITNSATIDGTQRIPTKADLQGTGCSAGRVKAPARVVINPHNESLAPGEILVARYTDPGWIALFTNASGIVVERGSLLSHSAIVARELGIPCVVGVKNATKHITTSELIEIDGTTGTVRKADAR